MSRIRSTHPGVWTDERFVSVSAFARLLFMGIWNECDDFGSFEWSPIKLKMRLLPADAVDAAELLAELESAGSVMRYECGGKAYGAVRNFCQYQRPKKPTHAHPQTEAVEAWVNIEARLTRDGSEAVGNELPTGGEKPRQMKDEGGKGRPIPAKAEIGKTARKRARSSDFEVPEDIPAVPWAAFAEQRKRRGKPLDSYTAKQLFGRLRTIREAGWNLEDVINKAAIGNHDGFWMPDGRDSNIRRSTNGSAGKPMNVEQLRSAIRFAEDHDDPDRAAELKRQLAAMSKPPDPKVASLIRTATNGLRVTPQSAAVR